MAWKQLEPTGPHVTYLTLTSFLILYALFSLLIRNRLHLSEPPLATIFGIITGPRALNFIRPYDWGEYHCTKHKEINADITLPRLQ
jgi:NhaP-type Na+/H+ or K+/H+ antiporter